MRKPSNISPRNAPDWRPTLFFDQTQGAELLIEILRAAKWRVELHSAHFPGQSNLKDHVWIPAAMSKVQDCAIISADKSMRLWTAEGGLVRPVIEQVGAKVFFLSSTTRVDKRSLEEQATAVIHAQREICRCYRRYQNSFFIGRIHMGSRLGEVQKLGAGGRRPQKKQSASADVA